MSNVYYLTPNSRKPFSQIIREQGTVEPDVNGITRRLSKEQLYDTHVPDPEKIAEILSKDDIDLNALDKALRQQRLHKAIIGTVLGGFDPDPAA